MLSRNYKENVATFAALLRETESFDLIRRTLPVGEGELSLFYIDGFVKDAVMQKLMQGFLDLKMIQGSARDFADRIPYVEVDATDDTEMLLSAVLSGATVIFGTSFGAGAVILDARTYPARQTAEPDNDRVMTGAHDGFVETLIFNTALLRRRIRDPRLTMRYIGIRGNARTDVVVCFLQGVAEEEYVEAITKKLRSLSPGSLTLGAQSLAECLIRRRWFNPFPKIRRLERPDAAAAEVYEGRILILCDTSPQVLVLPTFITDFLQETDDYYFPPLTGTYLRAVRHVIFWLAPFLPALWFWALQNTAVLPSWLAFVVPDDPGALPILLQLYLAELAVDALKLASMNAPGMLSNSLSVIGGLILGDFAVTVGWFCPDVIFYMAVVAVAGFTQRSHELSYAFKFMRMLILGLVALLGGWGILLGGGILLLLLCTNTTLNNGKSYLYPLFPFRPRALSRLLWRFKKNDL